MVTDVREIVNGIRMINTLFILVIRSVLSNYSPPPPRWRRRFKITGERTRLPYLSRHHNGRLNSLNAARYQRTRRSRLITDDYWIDSERDAKILQSTRRTQRSNLRTSATFYSTYWSVQAVKV